MKTLLLTLSLFSAINAFAEPILLVTLEEMQASNDAPPVQISSKSSPLKDNDAPVIEVLTPKLPGSISSPTLIDLQFLAVSPSKVKPESFKALYGTFQIDITKKLLSVAKVTEGGVKVQEAALPKGIHKIMLMIEDNSGRVGKRTIEFEVK
jgi:hypothetical protein